MRGSKKKIYILLMLAVFLLVTGINAAVYEFRLLSEKSIELPDGANVAGSYRNYSGNHVAICERNGLKTFPFMTGGTLKLLSLPDGKIFTVADDKSLMGGLSSPVVVGNSVFYERSWDGSEQGEIYRKNINNGEVISAGDGYDGPVYMTENELFSIDSEGDDNGAVTKRDLSTGRETKITKEKVDHFTLDGKAIFCYERGKGRLFRIDQNSDTDVTKSFSWGKYNVIDMQADERYGLFIQTGKDGIFLVDNDFRSCMKVADSGDMTNFWSCYRTSFMHEKDGVLYYCDSSGDIYGKDMKTGSSEKIISSPDINFTGLEEKLFKDSSLIFSWCSDYIVIQEAAFDDSPGFHLKRSRSGIIAFDYEGNKIYSNDKVDLDL